MSIKVISNNMGGGKYEFQPLVMMLAMAMPVMMMVTMMIMKVMMLVMLNMMRLVLMKVMMMVDVRSVIHIDQAPPDDEP